MSIDTLKVARRFRDAGFTEPQAEAVVDAVRESDEASEGATKQDLALLAAELRAEMAKMRSEMAALRTELRSEMRELEQRVVALVEAAKAELVGKMFSMVVGAVLVNIVAMLGVMFAFAKMLGH
jgi:DNA-binding transcriptional MerR regulator